MTQYATLNEERIVSGVIGIPYYGIWVADLVLASTVPVTKSCNIRIANLGLVGSIFRMASFSGSRSARVVGGFGGWGLPIAAQSYYNPSGVKISMILTDAAASAGEKILVKSQDVTNKHFIRENKVASNVLRQVLGDKWYVDEQGITQTIPRTNDTKISTPFTVGAWSGAKGHFDIATEDLASWMPGRTFQNDNIPNLQTISLSTFTLDNDGKLRVGVLTTGHELFQ